MSAGAGASGLPDVAFLLRRSAAERQHDTAVSEGGRLRTYGELDDRARRLANGLRGMGLRPGDRVAVLLTNRLEYPEIDAGLVYADLVRVALNSRLTVDDFSYVIDDAETRAVISEPRFDEVAAELASRHDVRWLRLDGPVPDPRALRYDDIIERSPATLLPTGTDAGRTAWISYTSGTTGSPKGVMLSHRALVQVATNVALETGPIGRGSGIVLTQPLSHGSGFFVLPYLAGGGAVHLMSRFDPGEAKAIGRRHRAQVLKIVPTMLESLVAEGGDSPFDMIVYGAAPITRPLIERASDRFGPVLVQIYGQVEAPVTITVMQRNDHARSGPHLASAGRPWRTVRVLVVDEAGEPVPPGQPGEVVVSSPHVMSGYYRRPDLTSEVLRDGWLWTRDLGQQDEAGFVYLHGRRDDMINSGGYTIAPKEVEDVLVLHASVAECAVVPVPDERWGQAVCAYVRVPAGAARPTAEELMEYCRPRLGFRRPRSIRFVDELPMTPYGKVDRSQLTRTHVGLADGAGLAASAGADGEAS